VESYLRQHLPLFGLVGIYLAAGWTVEARTGVEVGVGPLGPVLMRAVMAGSGILVLTAGVLTSGLLAGRALSAVRGLTGGGGVRTDLRRLLSMERALGIFTVWALVMVLLDQFLAFKDQIPALNPFTWDVRLMELDRAIHFNRQPWELLHPLLGRPSVTRGLDLLYYGWFLVNAGLFSWMAWRRWDSLRSQFFLAYFLVWSLIGTLFAIALSSAGPVYFEAVVGEPGPFRPLLAYLEAVALESPLTALELQPMLWRHYMGEIVLSIGGITAMPSVHVAVPVLFTLVAFRFRGWAGWLAGAYALLVFVGSIHLGWHYAVDGYATLILVPGVWFLAGWIARGALGEPVPGGEARRLRSVRLPVNPAEL
jgi:hypothetical protein